MGSPKLIIRTTPRTGSNLLCHSLATHPDVRYAGEYYNNDISRIYPEYLNNRISGNWNLTKTLYLEPIPPKLFSSTTVLPKYSPSVYSEPIPYTPVTVFLYRENISEQHASYLKACQTGEWIAGCFNTPEIPIKNFIELVQQTNTKLINICSYHISYEKLISYWDESITKILDMMKWKQQSLSQATQRVNIKI